MDFEYYSAAPAQTVTDTAAFLRRVYNWMCLGLALTGLIAWMVAGTPAILQLVFGNKWVFYGLLLAELGLVIAIGGAINRLSAAAATGLFVFYAALNGVTMASIFLLYTRSSIASTFFVTAATFGAMSAYGYLTKRDLSKWGSFLFMGLIGIVVASLVNIFLKSPAVTWVVSACGVIVFTGLTAYDTFKLRAMAAQGFRDEQSERKGAILGALTLYLDFINLFLMLLRLFGGRRD